MNYKKFILTYLAISLAFTTAVFATDTASTPSIQANPNSEAKIPQALGIGFEAYRKALDDLFFLSLKTNQNTNFGINEIIVGLNGKIKTNPNDQESLAYLGHIYRILGQPREANRFYQKALALGADKFQLNSFSGVMLLQLQDFEKSIEALSHSLELNPNDSDIWILYGRALLYLQDFNNAGLSYEKALSLNPASEEAVMTLVTIYERQKKYDDAIRVLNTFLKAIPDHKMAKFHMGVVYLAKKQPELAVQNWEELYYAGVREPQFLFNLSIAYLESGESKKSEKILEHLQFFFPRNADLLFLTAEANRQMNRLDDAARNYRKAIAEDASLMSARIGLAQVLQEMGKSKESQKILKKTAEYFKSKS